MHKMTAFALYKKAKKEGKIGAEGEKLGVRREEVGVISIRN